MHLPAKQDYSSRSGSRTGQKHLFPRPVANVSPCTRSNKLPTDVGSLNRAANDGHALVEIGVEISEQPCTR